MDRKRFQAVKWISVGVRFPKSGHIFVFDMCKQRLSWQFFPSKIISEKKLTNLLKCSHWQCSPYQSVTGKTYRLKHYSLPPRTAWKSWKYHKKYPFFTGWKFIVPAVLETRENTDWLFNFSHLDLDWAIFFAKNIQKGFILMRLIVWYLKITNCPILSMTTDDRPKSGRVRAKSCLTGQCDWHLSVSNFKPEKGM